MEHSLSDIRGLWVQRYSSQYVFANAKGKFVYNVSNDWGRYRSLCVEAIVLQGKDSEFMRSPYTFGTYATFRKVYTSFIAGIDAYALET